MTNAFQFLDLEVDRQIGVVTMNRPPVNAVNQQMYREIEELFSDVERFLPEAKVVVLRGAGKHFSAGNDLEEFMTLTPENSPGRMLEVRAAFFAISSCPLPVIGAVRGAALGTGTALAASCDFVIGAAGATLGVPELTVGVMGGARHLARLVPQPVLRWMYLSADPVPVEQLAQWGALIEIVEPERLDDAAMEAALRIARHSAAALRMAKRSLNKIEGMELEAGYTLEQTLTGELSGHPDSREAVAAVKERREPTYSDEVPPSWRKSDTTTG